MQLLTYLVGFTIITAALSENCENFGILFYEDLGCTPHYDKSKSCPTKFTCDKVPQSEDTCFLKGRTYQVGDAVDNNFTYPTCSVGCNCLKRDTPTPEFECAALDCPEWLGAPVGRTCNRNFTLDKCCSTGEICGPWDKFERCEANGKKYYEGDRFYPENTCLTCVCQKGFTGKFEEPFCKKRGCDVRVGNAGKYFRKGCAPVYWKSDGTLCCPSDWVCPDGSEKIKGDAKSDETCKFGEKTLKVGQSYEKLNVEDVYGRKYEKVKCECVIPPLAMCIV